MLDPHFALAGAALNFIGDSDYALKTIKGKTKPNRVSWLLWSVAPLIAFSAELQQGVGIQSAMTFATGAAPLLVLIASFVDKNAYWHLSRFDIGCGVLAVLGLILWQLTGTGNVAIALSILADLFAGIPTIVKSYLQPETESYGAFIFGAVSAIITLLTISHWNFAAAGFPIYIFCVCSLLVVLIKFPKFRWPANRVGEQR